MGKHLISAKKMNFKSPFITIWLRLHVKKYFINIFQIHISITCTNDFAIITHNIRNADSKHFYLKSKKVKVIVKQHCFNSS